MSQRTTKPYNKTSATSEDSDQPAHARSLTRVFADRMYLLQPPGYKQRDKREPLPYWVDVYSDLCLCWSHKSYCRFCRALAQIVKKMSRRCNNHRPKPTNDTKRKSKQSMTEYTYNTLRKHACSNILKIWSPKNEKILIKNSDIFPTCTKHRLWVLVRTASSRWF